MKLFYFLCIALCGSFVFGQALTCSEIEKVLSDAGFKKEKSFMTHSDSLDNDSADFDRKMYYNISQNPQTLHCPFNTLIDSNYCDVTTSADNLLRRYDWDTNMGGTMRQFSSMFQFQSGEVISTSAYIRNIEIDDFGQTDEDEDDSYDPGTFCSGIYTLKTKSKTYYLAITNGIYSNKDCSQAVECYTIEDGKLNTDAKIIKTSEGMTSQISFFFDFFSVVDRPERPVKLIKYDEGKKRLYIPIVHEDGKVTNKFIVYKFNGEYFERLATTTKKRKR